MHGRRRSHAWLMHLMAGAALGAVVVLVVWIFSGGRPFGEVVGTGDVSAPTPAATERNAAGARPEGPAERVSRLAAEPPEMGSRSKEMKFRKPKAKRTAKARRATKARTKRRSPARRPAPRVTAPAVQPAEQQQLPVAAVPSPAATAAPPAPVPSGGAKQPAKRRAPTYVVGAGEG